MYSKFMRCTIAATLLLTAPIAASADNLGAAIVGGIIGGAIMNGAAQQRKQTTTTRYYAPSATRTANRETQTALNYFGFNAGTPDGVMGARSRSAISQYQVYMGFPGTGSLLPHERDYLVASYNRALVGGPDVTRSLNRSKDGVRGLLVAWRGQSPFGGAATGHGGMGYAGLPIEVSDAVDEIAESTEPSPEQLLQRAGFIQTADLNGDGQNDYIVDTSVTGSTFWCGASQCTTMLFVSSADGYQRRQFQYLLNPQRTNTVQVSYFQCDHTGCRMNDPLAGGGAAAPQYAAAPAPVAPMPQTQMATVPAPAPAAPATLPTFAIPAPAAAPAPSLASYCEKVSLLTSSNGGYVTAATMTDPKIALGEQFCYSRTYAKTAGEQLMQKVPGLTPAGAAQQCAGFEPVLAPYVASLQTTPAQQVVANVAQYAASSGMTADQLATTARICLYSGYQGDSMGVALGSALLLTALGEAPYAELVGHHLNEGFGVPATPVAATGWYSMAILAQESGATPVFGDSLPGRVELLRAAALGALNPAQASPAPTVVPTALPSFSVSE